MEKILYNYKPEEIVTLFEILFTNLREGVIIVDEDMTIISVNQAFNLITGYSSDEVVGKKPSFLKSNHHDEKFYNSIWSKLNSIGRWKGDIWDRHKNGETFLIDLSIIAIKTNKSDKKLYIGIYSEYSSSKMHLSKTINTDPLTNLPNRTLFRDHLGFMLAHARRNNQIVALLLIDIDRFKFTNETLGFSVGDTILIKTARRLRKILREVDGVFRLGNDEFAIVLEEIKEVNDAAKVAKKVLQIISTPINLPAYEKILYISASIGISVFPQDGADFEELIQNSEAAMYKAKEIDQNYYQFYSRSINASSLNHLTMEHLLHRALNNNEIILHYQPIIDIKKKTIIGAEALVRWDNPELGLVSPVEFIPIAEETGLIISIGEYIMLTACKNAKEWHDLGFNDCHISINLSAKQFEHHNLVPKLEHIIAKSGFPSNFVHIEITESLGMKNAKQTIEILKKLRQKGIHISIDDFGTGYSSLSYLKKFPVNTLKIDRSFINDLEKENDSATISTLIISMAHALNFKVIAEGVETEKQLQFLENQKCDMFQGYLFSRPVPNEEFKKLLYMNRKKSSKSR